MGRTIIAESKELAETEFGAEVVYGDTDSLFLQSPEATDLEKSKAFGDRVAAAVTARYPDPVELEYEKVYWPICFKGKKMYVGRVFEDPARPDISKLDAKVGRRPP